MRALFLDNIEEDVIIVDGDKFHHFANVIRIKVGELVKIFNGNGEERHYEVAQILKKSLTLKSRDEIKKNKKTGLEIALGITKKEAFDLCLKQAIELGIETIHIVKTEFSNNLDMKDQRLKSLLIGAMEQSNKTYFPLIISYPNLQDFLEKIKDRTIVYLDSKSNKNLVKNIGKKKIIPLVGPEGGFSEKEIKHLEVNNSLPIHFPDQGIMRTPTAMSFGFGYLRAVSEIKFED